MGRDMTHPQLVSYSSILFLKVPTFGFYSSPLFYAYFTFIFSNSSLGEGGGVAAWS